MLKAGPHTPPHTPPLQLDDEIEPVPSADSGHNQWKENQTKTDKMKTPPHKTICGQPKWDVLSNWDLTAQSNSEINAQLLLIASEKMEESGVVEWPTTPDSSIFSLAMSTALSAT
jgi:hypothetical protein